MANDLTKAMSNIPAHIAALMGSTSPAGLGADLSGGLNKGSIPRISLKASRFRIVENGNEIRLKETELDVIIVGANPGLSKTYYERAWDPDDEPAAPDCWSMDGTFPDESIADPIHDKCATCPKNQWGSKLTPAGKQIKACADQKRLAVVSADDPGTVYLVQVTPAALQGLSAYNGQLQARGLEPNWITTTLSFDDEASFPKLIFSFGGFPTADALERVSELDPDEVRRVVYGDLTIPAPQKAIEAPAKVKTKPVVEEEEEEVPAPKAKPKRRMARPTEDEGEEVPAPKAKPKLAVVEDNDDDDVLESFAKRKPREEPEVEAKTKPKTRAKPVPNMEDNEDDEPAPTKPKRDPEVTSLADSIKAKLGGMYAVEEEGDDA